MHVAYICDRKQCENCHIECNHTTNIEHAVNFECINGNTNHYMEKPINGAPVWDFEDAVKFIADKTLLYEDHIREILHAEEEYMKSIGLIEEED